MSRNYGIIDSARSSAFGIEIIVITAVTERPKSVLNSIRTAIDNGSIDTWAYDTEGDFTHTRPQWNEQAYLRPSVEANKLCFYILMPQSTKSDVLYAVYHGRFIEMLLGHFDDAFTLAFATAQPAGSDHIWT